MCIIQAKNARVSNTLIVAAAHRAHEHLQVNVYSNRVSTHDDSAAMILPFPNFTGNNYLEVVDEPRASEIFETLEQCFPYRERATRSLDTFSMPEKLAVHTSGSYIYSVANTLDELCRLDAGVFSLEDMDLRAVLEAHYSSHFGFLICMLKNKDVKYEPLMYITERMPDGKFFTPTRHYHGAGDEARAHWDHKIYIINAASAPPRDVAFFEPASPIKRLHRTIQFPIPEKCFLLRIAGRSANRDIIV